MCSSPLRTSNTKKRIYLETLGCAKNRVDSEIMLNALQSNGFEITIDPEIAEVIVVNTCAFLTKASEESISRILDLSDLKSKGNCEKLVATGCLTQRYKDSLFKEIPELDGLLGSNGFEKIPKLINSIYKGNLNSEIYLNSKPHYEHHERINKIKTTANHFAYVKIAEGCSNMCSFCNIPLLRGNFSSRTINSITNEIIYLTKKGVKEINLISQDTSSYGKDFNDSTGLEYLLSRITNIEGDFWIRLFYCYPNAFESEALKIISSDKRFCRYLDMPLQHINNAVLNAMNRKIDRNKIEKKINEITKFLPNAAWRTTFIVGFPNESEEAFKELLEFVSEGHFQHVGIFMYSHEDNIRSAKYGDPIPNQVKRERKNQLMEAQQKISFQKNKEFIGKKIKVLVDGVSNETDLLLQSRSEFQGPEVDGVVYINKGNTDQGKFYNVKITEAHPYDLIGHVV